MKGRVSLITIIFLPNVTVACKTVIIKSIIFPTSRKKIQTTELKIRVYQDINHLAKSPH